MKSDEQLQAAYGHLLGPDADPNMRALVRDLDAVSKASRPPQTLTASIQAAIAARGSQIESARGYETDWESVPEVALQVPAAPVVRDSMTGRKSLPILPRFSLARRLVGVGIFVVLLALLGVAAMLSRMEPGKTTPAVHRRQAAGQLTAIQLHDQAHNTVSSRSVDPELYETAQVRSLVDEILRMLPQETIRCECSILADRIKRESLSLDLEYASPGVLGGYTKVLIPLDGRAFTTGVDITTDTHAVLLGTDTYTRLHYVQALGPVNELRALFEVPILAPGKLPAGSADKAAQASLYRFIALAGQYSDAHKQKALAQSLDTQARALLNPELGSRVSDLLNLGIPTLTTAGGNGVRTVAIKSRINRNEASITVAYAFYNAGTYVQEFDLEQYDGKWKVNGVQPAAIVPVEQVLADERLLPLERAKVEDVSSSFVRYAVAAIAGRKLDVEGSRSEETIARSLVAPTYEAALNDFSRAGKVAPPVETNGYGMATRTLPAELIGQSRAVSDIQIAYEQNEATVRFTLQHSGNRWQITGIEPSPAVYPPINVVWQETPQPEQGPPLQPTR